MQHRGPAIALTLFLSAMLLCLLVVMLRHPLQRDELAGTRPVNYRIDPNTADTETLCILPRIGPGIAQRIVDDRQANGPFRDTRDMQRVPYVGEKTALAIEPCVAFETAEAAGRD